MRRYCPAAAETQKPRGDIRYTHQASGRGNNYKQEMIYRKNSQILCSLVHQRTSQSDLARRVPKATGGFLVADNDVQYRKAGKDISDFTVRYERLLWLFVHRRHHLPAALSRVRNVQTRE